MSHSAQESGAERTFANGFANGAEAGLRPVTSTYLSASRLRVYRDAASTVFVPFLVFTAFLSAEDLVIEKRRQPSIQILAGTEKAPGIPREGMRGQPVLVRMR